MNAANDLHVTDPVAKMEELVREAEAGNDKAILTARVVLANALIKGRPVDEDRLQRLAIRVGKHALTACEDRRAGRHQARMTWGSLLSACSDYIEHKQVAMHDGRCATADGWNYENCEPGTPEQVYMAAGLYPNGERATVYAASAETARILFREQCPTAEPLWVVRYQMDDAEKF